ncbi:hypothetical protein ACMA1D_15610 [Streptomyces sp. 796.1]|uniref:hypothetical protein n=1 Tax=Streptomyces sp. 796.1 TaxID=3163029 RepID=UPI0039C95E6D
METTPLAAYSEPVPEPGPVPTPVPAPAPAAAPPPPPGPPQGSTPAGPVDALAAGPYATAPPPADAPPAHPYGPGAPPGAPHAPGPQPANPYATPTATAAASATPGAHPPPGGGYGFGAPPPTAPPPPPAQAPDVPVAADPWRAVAVAVLNASGLGAGYALVRMWWAVAVCWVAVGGLLAFALPAEPDGVSGAVVIGFAVVWLAAVAHGAFVGLRRRLVWPPRAPVAVLLGIVLLAAPLGGFVAYDAARDEATEEMLLDRLAEADRLVEATSGERFDSAESDYRAALALYGGLIEDHPDSRAGRRVPDRLAAYYESVGAPYARQDYCGAMKPLKYLRTVPRTIDKEHLGALATWPDDRLATSLYECGAPTLGAVDDSAGEVGSAQRVAPLTELLTDFPRSAPAKKVEPAVTAAVRKAADDIEGADPCGTVRRLRVLSSQATTLAGAAPSTGGGLRAAAGTASGHLRAGAYACGVDQYEEGEYAQAITTLTDFTTTYRNDKKRALAEKIIIAAEVAKSLPDAGKKLPTTDSGGSVSLTVKNDSPNEVEILYTGRVTGKFSLPACKGCTTYASREQAKTRACKGSTKRPQRTLSLPLGTTYFLHRAKDKSVNTGTDTVKIESGYVYTECAYEVSPFGLGPAD